MLPKDRVCGAVGQPGTDLLGGVVEAGEPVYAEIVFGGDTEGVVIGVDGTAETPDRIERIPQLGVGGFLCAVAV
ncbi:hypothetical protein, partial [Nocardia farcinica]|uniref:hypothetical protein n=1 Tax=Nocardia farcinica TaxID=37329 RepID=UPI0034DAEE45